jgi:phosphoglycolate phosphatase-like HAD superfamily hydrolase
VDSGPVITAALRSALFKCGVAVDPALDLSSFVGPPLERSLARVVPDRDAAARVLDVYREEYSRIIETSTPLMPAAETAVRSFSEAGASLAVVTYKPTTLAESVLAGTGLRGYFGVVLGTALRDDLRTKADLLLEAVEALRPHRLSPVYVGDHPEDEAAAVACGIAFVAYGPNQWTDIMKLVLAR